MWRRGDRLPSDVQEIAQRLREERPQASPLELDQIKTATLSRGRARRPRRGVRSLVVTALTLGVLTVGAGGAVAGGFFGFGGFGGGGFFGGGGNGGQTEYHKCPPPYFGFQPYPHTGGGDGRGGFCCQPGKWTYHPSSFSRGSFDYGYWSYFDPCRRDHD
jgi:hypothetical protein